MSTLQRQYHTDGDLPENGEIFVFGSNKQGLHGLGAAQLANEKYGARYYKGKGLSGQSFAIPTREWLHRDKRMVTLPLNQIYLYIDEFVEFTKHNPDMKFWVTSVGCGYAGYRASDIAPRFREAINCSFPHTWEQSLYVADLKDQVRK